MPREATAPRHVHSAAPTLHLRRACRYRQNQEGAPEMPSWLAHADVSALKSCDSWMKDEGNFNRKNSKHDPSTPL
jgi:hypothetical protein